MFKVNNKDAYFTPCSNVSVVNFERVNASRAAFLAKIMMQRTRNADFNSIRLTHFNLMFHFSTPSKRQKTFGFLTFSGGREMEHWAKIG